MTESVHGVSDAGVAVGQVWVGGLDGGVFHESEEVGGGEDVGALFAHAVGGEVGGYFYFEDSFLSGGDVFHHVEFLLLQLSGFNYQLSVVGFQLSVVYFWSDWTAMIYGGLCRTGGVTGEFPSGTGCDHLKSDLSSPVISFESEISVSDRALLISSDLYSIVIFGSWHSDDIYVNVRETFAVMSRLLSSS